MVLEDDAAQSPRALAFLSRLTADEPGLVNDVTRAEFVWALERTAVYRRNAISQALRSMLSSPSYRLPDRTARSKALTRFGAEKKMGFADALIGEIKRAAGCSTTYTFEVGAAKTDLFSPL